MLPGLAHGRPVTAEAIERVLSLVRRGMVELISSKALQDEVRRNPSG